jgi:hypothetical protein
MTRKGLKHGSFCQTSRGKGNIILHRARGWPTPWSTSSTCGGLALDIGHEAALDCNIAMTTNESSSSTWDLKVISEDSKGT